MPITLDLFCFDFPFTMILAVLFSVATGAGGCKWPISGREVCIDVAYWQF